MSDGMEMAHVESKRKMYLLILKYRLLKTLQTLI